LWALAGAVWQRGAREIEHRSIGGFDVVPYTMMSSRHLLGILESWIEDHQFEGEGPTPDQRGPFELT
jgi:hypothetical protein